VARVKRKARLAILRAARVRSIPGGLPGKLPIARERRIRSAAKLFLVEGESGRVATAKSGRDRRYQAIITA